MASMQRTVHVGKGEGAEMFGEFLAKLSGSNRVERDLFRRWRVDFEDLVVGPFLLVSFFYCYKGIALVGLQQIAVVSTSVGGKHK